MCAFVGVIFSEKRVFRPLFGIIPLNRLGAHQPEMIMTIRNGMPNINSRQHLEYRGGSGCCCAPCLFVQIAHFGSAVKDHRIQNSPATA